MSAHWADTLQALYDSEINWKISTFWDGGFTWELGDETNGFVAEGTTFTFGEAVEQMSLKAHELYKDSVFHLGRSAFIKNHPEWFHDSGEPRNDSHAHGSGTRPSNWPDK